LLPVRSMDWSLQIGSGPPFPSIGAMVVARQSIITGMTTKSRGYDDEV
jgi:hypothetical protein